MGGAGKTPTALAVASLLKDLGHIPAFLSRGYGGSLKGPVHVDPTQHSANEVGDEPLLLARSGDAWVSRNRADGARAIEDNGKASVIIMDDGFQNPGLEKSLSILVTNGTFGIGNGAVFPAGPLREPWQDALTRSDALLIIGDDRHGLSANCPIPMLEAVIKPRNPDALDKNASYLAFAGIGMPEKFFTTLRDMGLNLIETLPYPDHYRYTQKDLATIREKADMCGAIAITTEKDLMRISSSERPGIETLPVGLCVSDPAKIESLLKTALG